MFTILFAFIDLFVLIDAYCILSGDLWATIRASGGFPSVEYHEDDVHI